MIDLKKTSALLIVSVMLMSGLAIFINMPVVTGDYVVSLDFALNYENQWQEPSTEPPDPTTELIYNWDDDNFKPYWLGDTDTEMQVGIVNIDPVATIFTRMNDTEVSLSCPDGAIFNIVGQDGGSDSTDEVGNINGNGGLGNAKFYFDISPTAALGLHRIEIFVEYEKDSCPDSDTGLAWIYISSIFDDTATPDQHNELPDFDETTPGEDAAGRFEAGDTFVEGGLVLHNYATDITDVVVTYTPPTDGEPDYIDVVGNIFVCEIPGGIPAGGEQTAIWRLNIAEGTPPDEYTCQADITYIRNGQNVNEYTRDIYMEVDFAYRTQFPEPNDQPYSDYQCRNIQPISIANGSFVTRIINISVENNGNTPIYNFAFYVEDIQWPIDLIAPQFYWVESNVSYYDVTTPTYSILNIGEVINLELQVVVEPGYSGTMERFIYYDGFYYNDGSTGDPTGFYPIFGGDSLPTGDPDDLQISLWIETIPVTAGSSEVYLSEGWNLISLPLFPGDVSIPNALADITGKWDYICAYDSVTDTWNTNCTYRPDSVNDLTDINYKMGFWINITEPGCMISFGPQPGPSTIQLYSGWNLVGYPTLDTTTNIASALWGTQADSVMVCDPAEPYLIREVGPNYIMQPGEGYWVHVPADVNWLVDW